MGVYRVKGTITVDVAVEVEGNNKEDALSNFYAMNIKDIYDGSALFSWKNEDVDAELLEAELIVEVKNIEYNISSYDIPMSDDYTDEELATEIERIKSSLPKELVVSVRCIHCNDELKLEDDIREQVWDDTGYEVKSLTYKILETN